jgi:DNA polymerase
VSTGPAPPSFEEILAAPDYPAFAALLRDSGCRRCALAAGRTRIVVDRGSPAGRLLAIGEGPGETEDREGLAFVGRAGRLLDGLLRDVGLDPERDLLIANVVKCRPPGNRTPDAEEARACIPYLHRQIALAAPRAVLLLGATAVRHFIETKRSFAMERVVGRSVELAAWPGVGFFPLYHPAYLLRDPRRRPLAVAHLEALRERLRAEGSWPGDGCR